MINIRPFQNSDADALVEIYKRAVENIGPKAYNPEQVAVWANLLPNAERFAEIMNDGRVALVAVDADDRVVAFTDVEADGHIGFLYALPDVAGKGVAKMLYEALETKAREQDIGKLYSEASELAKSFLLKHGFSVVERRDFEVAGVPIHNYAVEKRLRTPR